MRHEGSAFQGLGVVTFKELSDHLTGVRMIVLEWLVVLMALGVVYTGIQQIREVSAEDPFLFLRLFTRAGEGLPSFVSVLSFLVPLVAIGIGFDLINSERNQRTLSRILAQPIYRDALLFGKFLAGLMTITIMLVAWWLMVIGLGLIFLGVPPGGEEIARSLVIDPHFLLLDEPFSGIDPIQVLELQRIIFDLKRSGIGILITDHAVRETLVVTDRAYIINNGRIFRAGSPEALERDPEVKRIYLGESFSLRV